MQEPALESFADPRIDCQNFLEMSSLNSLKMSSGSDPIHNAETLCLVAGWTNLVAKRRGLATRREIVRVPAHVGFGWRKPGCRAAGIDAKGARA
jgi:hypothetical protein